MGRELARQTSKLGSNPSWDTMVHPVCETFNGMRVVSIMREFKNHYIKCTVTGPITSWCSRSTQSAAGIKIAVIGMSASEDTDRTQGLKTTWPPAKSVSQDSEIAQSRTPKTLCKCSWKRGVSNGLNTLSLWELQGPTSQHLFIFFLNLIFTWKFYIFYMKI